MPLESFDSETADPIPGLQEDEYLSCVACDASYGSVQWRTADKDPRSGRVACPDCGEFKGFVRRRPVPERTIADRWPADLVADGWTPIPNAFWDYATALGLDHMDQALLLRLERYRRGDKAVWPGAATLAQQLGCDRRTVYRRLNSLEQRGFIEGHRRRDARGHNLPTEWRRDGLIKKLRQVQVADAAGLVTELCR